MSLAGGATLTTCVLSRLPRRRHSALVTGGDPYSSSGSADLAKAAESASITIATTQVITDSDAMGNFSSQLRQLELTEANVFVLWCPTALAGHFLRSAYETGIGGEGTLWLGADTLVDSGLWEGDAQLASDRQLRQRVLRGLFSVAPVGQPTTASYEAYLAVTLTRHSNLPPRLSDSRSWGPTDRVFGGPCDSGGSGSRWPMHTAAHPSHSPPTARLPGVATSARTRRSCRA